MNRVPLSLTAAHLQSLVLAAVPHGGQRLARRNAWSSMSEDAVQATARRDAEQAMIRAATMASHPAASAR